MDELKNFVSAQFLQSHWKILPAELLDFILSGLPAYRQTGLNVEASELLSEKTLSDITKELALRAARDSEARKCRSFITLANIPSSFAPRDFRNTIIPKVPSTPPPATTGTLSGIHTEAKRVFEKLRKRKDNQTLTDLNTFLFKREEINQFAQLQGLKLIDEGDSTNDELDNTEKKTILKIENYLHYEHRSWSIQFHGKKTVLQDFKYIRYISLLLEKPGTKIRALELVHTVEGNTLGKQSIEQALDEGLSVARKYRDEEVSNKQLRYLEKLQADISAETDPLVKKEMQKEFTEKTASLRNMNALVDHDNRPAKPPKKQRIDDPLNKKAQHAIRKGLEQAYSSLKKRGMKALAEHLKDNIKPGGNYDFCYYDPKTIWDIKL